MDGEPAEASIFPGISFSLHSITGFDQRELAIIQRSPFGAIISAMA
jgi:hypothetical protein